MRWLIPLITITILIQGCRNQEPTAPEQRISEDTYIDLMVELQLVRSFGETNALDSLVVDSLTEEIFQKYEITDSVFVENHRYYQQFPQQQLSRIEEAIERLKMDQVADSTTQDSVQP